MTKKVLPANPKWDNKNGIQKFRPESTPLKDQKKWPNFDESLSDPFNLHLHLLNTHSEIT